MAELKRRLDRIDALAIALGSVIGTGVFLNTGITLRGTGGLAGATLLWIAVGVVCLAGAILYADLSARVPEAGGPYAYVRVAFGRPVGFVYGWMNAAVAMPARQASSVAAIGLLASRWLPGGDRLLGAIVLLLLTGTNLLGIKAGAVTQRVFTAGKIATLVLVIGLATTLALGGAPRDHGEIEPVAFAVALSAVWYTYLGWQDVVLLAEELHEPRRDLPVVLVATVALTTVLYTVVHIAVFFGLGGGAEAYGELPARDIAGHVLGGFGFALLSGLTMSSMIGGSAESMLVRPRVAMALARDGMAPAAIAAINRAGTPHGAILFHAAISLVVVATGSYTQILPLLTFAQGFLGLFETASYFVIRRKRPELPTSRFHPWAPIVFIVANAALCWIAGTKDLVRTLTALGAIAAISLVYGVARRWLPPPRRGPGVTGSSPDTKT